MLSKYRAGACTYFLIALIYFILTLLAFNNTLRTSQQNRSMRLCHQLFPYSLPEESLHEMDDPSFAKVVFTEGFAVLRESARGVGVMIDYVH